MSKVTACLYANVNDSVDEKGQNLSLLHKRQSCSWIGPQAIQECRSRTWWQEGREDGST